MCVSLLERVKQGKSNIILILILSARSQDRDQQGSAKRLLLNYFNPLGRKTETGGPVGRTVLGRHFNPLGRKTETSFCGGSPSADAFQSTRSQDRDSKTKQLLIILSPFLYTFHT